MAFEAGWRPYGRGHVTDEVSDSFPARPRVLSRMTVAFRSSLFPQAKKLDFLVIRLAAADWPLGMKVKDERPL
jgi:hypothetical protein